MKPPAFVYDAPRSLDEVIRLLAEHGDEARVLAGGQSLVPQLNLRLVRPARIVDLNGVDELACLGAGRIGAMTRVRQVEREGEIPLLRQAVRQSGHAQIRNRGTVGGSCARADPRSELPCALLALDARFHLRSSRGDRVVPAGEFFEIAYETALAADEVLTEVEVASPPARARAAFLERAPVHGDFAIAGVAVLLVPFEDGRIERAAISLLAVADRPMRAGAAEAALAGEQVTDESAREAAALAIAELEPPGDVRASSEYRRALTEELIRRALLEAAA